MSGVIAGKVENLRSSASGTSGRKVSGENEPRKAAVIAALI
jgi:hypothetical protein